MKFTIDIDCTPEEAREFLGLPDVRPLQAALMTELEQQMRQAVAASSPEALLKQWFNIVPLGMEQMQKAMGSLMHSAAWNTAPKNE